MANDLCTTYANRLIDWALATGSPTRPSAVYVALGTGSSSTGLSGELSGNGYARQSATFDAASNRATSNATLIEFGPNTTSNWGTVSHMGIYDASTGGNCIWAGSLSAAKTASVGDKITFQVGALDVLFSQYAD